MSKDNLEIDFPSAVIRIALENNALLKTVLHYLEKSEAARLNVSIDEVEAQTDEILSNNLSQATDLLNTPEE